MKHLLLIAALSFASCSNCGGNNTSPSNNGPNNDTDAGHEPDDMPVSNPPVVLNFERRVPLESVADNRLEDPNFGFQNESWFAVDSSEELQRVRRIYEPHSPDDRPIAGIIGGNGTTCLLGRMLWGAGDHSAQVYVSAPSGTVAVNVLGIDPSGPNWTSTALEVVDTAEDFGDERTWERYRTIARPRFGWGYFEICATSDETVLVGAPRVVELGAANALIRRAAPQPALAAQVRRIEAFEAWRRSLVR